MSNYYQQIIRQGAGIVTGFSPQTIKQVITKICDYYGLIEETNPIMVLDYKDKNEVTQSILYITKDGCSQLSEVFNISITKVLFRYDEKLGACISTAFGFKVTQNKKKRLSSDIGVEVINKEGLDFGFDLQSAILRSATKAKRRVILHLAGLGFLDEEIAKDMIDNKKD